VYLRKKKEYYENSVKDTMENRKIKHSQLDRNQGLRKQLNNKIEWNVG
jgi:hypothetical protein